MPLPNREEEPNQAPLKRGTVLDCLFSGAVKACLFATLNPPGQPYGPIFACAVLHELGVLFTPDGLYPSPIESC